jgi:transglutaminase-like putative cysteine protease
MRITISHETVYTYVPPANGVIQNLRMTPRPHHGQYVVDWRIDVSENCRLEALEDAFGNITHAFTADGPLAELRLIVEGEVETQDTSGVVRGTVEHFPPSLYLRETPLTEANAAILAFAQEVHKETGDDPLALPHRLLERIHDDFEIDPDLTATDTTAAQAFAAKRGLCRDLTHVFISAARSLGIPARYIGGYFHRADEPEPQHFGHGWAEAYVPAIGWIAFDPANGMCATDAHVRVAVGLDYVGASPVRGSRYGGGSESLAVSILVTQAGWQSQN